MTLPYCLLPRTAALLIGLTARPVIARAFPIAPVFLLASLLASEFVAPAEVALLLLAPGAASASELVHAPARPLLVGK